MPILNVRAYRPELWKRVNEMGMRLTDENRLSIQRPDLVAQMVQPELSTELSIGSNRMVIWKCPSDHHPYFEWEAIVSSRTKQGSGCPACSGRVAISGWNDLASINPRLAAQLVNKGEAANVTPWSHKELTWRCSDGHPLFEWNASVAKRSTGHGCWVCSGQAVLKGWNDIATTHPHLVSRFLHPEVATTVSVGSDCKVERVCDGTRDAPHPRFVWTTQTKKLATRGCGACSGKVVIVGWNDLGTRSPDLAAQLVRPDESRTVTVSSNKKLAWFCLGTETTPHPRCEWGALVSNRTNGAGCSECSKHGFDKSKPAFCYLIGGFIFGEHFGVKFGIANATSVDSRLRNHANTGLTDSYAAILFENGQDCWDFERELKDLLVLCDAQTCHKIGMDFDGKTETILWDDMPLTFFQHLSAKFTERGSRPNWVTPKAQAA